MTDSLIGFLSSGGNEELLHEFDESKKKYKKRATVNLEIPELDEATTKKFKSN